MRVRALLLAVVAALLASAAGVASSSSSTGMTGSQWVVTDLGNLGTARVTVSDINDRGQVVGAAPHEQWPRPRFRVAGRSDARARSGTLWGGAGD